MYQILPDITTQFILEHVRQEDIIEFYLGIRPFPGMLIRSPLREDANPSFKFYISKGQRLRYYDFSRNESGDVFDIVKKLFNLDLYQACQRIAIDFRLIEDRDRLPARGISIVDHSVKKPCIIQVKRRTWLPEDLKFWSKYHITQNTLDFYEVKPAEYIWSDGVIIYKYYKQDPGYIYNLQGNKYKVYFPLRKQFRFICNTSKLQGYNQLPQEGDLLIITKSMKDIMVYRELNLWAVAPQGEGMIISKDQFSDLSKRFKRIVSNYDFDRTGILGAAKMRREYNIQPLMLTNGKFNTKNYMAKDISDFIAKFGYEKAYALTH